MLVEIRATEPGMTSLVKTPQPSTTATSPPLSGKIVFYSERDGNGEIYVMNPGGSDQQRLTDNNTNEFAPAWSPDGQWIAFTTDRDGNHEIYWMAADGSNPTRLTNDPGWDYWPSWSPDGNLIVFSSGPTIAGLDFCVMNADGTNIRKILAQPGLDFEASWQP
jgi:Tol biopolymer transport system component